MICPEDKQQVFIWDTQAQGLGVRITSGVKSFIFQKKICGKDGKLEAVRIKIGACDAVLLEDARNIARQYAAMVGQGIDPRLEIRRTAENEAAERQERKRQDVTLSEVW